MVLGCQETPTYADGAPIDSPEDRNKCKNIEAIINATRFEEIPGQVYYGLPVMSKVNYDKYAYSL